MKLKEIRESKGLSQSQLAKRSGVSVRMIQKYEQGSQDINKAIGETLYRLSFTLELPIEDLLDTATIITDEERKRILEYLNL